MTLMKCAALVLSLAVAVAPGAAQSAKDVEDTAGNIVTKPLKDANIVQEKIPPALEAASAAPYSLKGLKTCQQLAAEIAKLDQVLGPDVDKLQPKSGESVGELALGSAEALAGSLIPGTGLIRKFSGAEAHEKKVKAAFYAGGLRRAFLKGTAGARGCKL